jgi:hypothetical protein
MMIPKYCSLSDWASSLIIDFPEDDIPILTDESNWKNWGNILIQEDSFADNGSPSTLTFKDWKTWASAVFLTMTNFS